MMEKSHEVLQGHARARGGAYGLVNQGSPTMNIVFN